MRNDAADATLAHAAHWFERLQNEDMDLDSIAEWHQWLTTSPAHREAFDKCHDLWQRLDRVPAPALPSREEMGLGRRVITLPRWALAAGIACLALCAALLGSLPWNQRMATTVYETAAAKQEEATFPDGSRLALGAKSMMWIRFGEQERAVTLERGEAYFEVAADQARPFVVHAGSTAITALGTAFNVRRSGERLLVAVTDGRVAVGSVQLHAGQQLTLERPDAKPTIMEVDPSAADAWRAGRLEYRGEPLKYVIADVNRYLPKEAVIADAEVGELLITGTLFADDVQAWLSGLDGFLPVYVETENGRTVLRKRE